MEELRIEYLPVDALKPYERNARKHKKDDVDMIVRSIEEFGFDDPIGVWGDKNFIVEGHGRLLAAKKLGMKTVPVIRLDHLTDEQIEALFDEVRREPMEIPEYVFDVHTRRGKMKGKTKADFFREEDEALSNKQLSIFDFKL